MTDVVARHHSCGQRAVRTDDAACAQLDVLLAIERGHGEADRRPLAEASEATRAAAARSDRPAARQGVPPRAHDRAGGDTSTVEEAPTPVNRQGSALAAESRPSPVAGTRPRRRAR